MSASFEFVPGVSRLLVWTYKEGLLSRVAHDLQLEATDLRAPVTLEDGKLSVEVVAGVAGLRARGQVKKGGEVVPLKPSDHVDIEANMAGAKVLDATRHPEIRFHGQGAFEGEGPLKLEGTLTIRGVTQPMNLAVRVTRSPEGHRVDGEVELRQTEFQIKPYSALMGALKVQDRIRVTWSLVYELPAGE
jgi:YceI-like domain